MHKSLLHNDGLLAEWGVHHFHLGTCPDKKSPNYIQRSGPLLFAFVTDNCFYAINVYSHFDFTNNDVIERIHENWPELIEKYRCKGVTAEPLKPDERKSLRAKNGNVFTSVPDGTVYSPISGGVTASGINAEAIKMADYWLIKMAYYQKEVEKMLDEILPVFIKHGYSYEQNIKATLRFQKNSFGFQQPKLWVFFPEYESNLFLYDSKYPFDIKSMLICKPKNIAT